MCLLNYRLTQLRAVVEQAFGRWNGRWRILKNLPLRSPDSAKILLATASLHNWLERRGTDPVLREWIERVKKDKEVQRTADAIHGDVEQVDMDDEDERSGQDARYALLQRLAERSDREYEHLLATPIGNDELGTAAHGIGSRL